MKIRFNRMLSIICAVMLMTCAVSVWAAAETAPATPTDLGPVENGEEEQETEDGPVDSIEILITKNLTLGQSWEGTVGKTKPAVLKLDLERAGTVYMVLEGKDAWATVEKSDRMTGNAPRRQVNPETDELIYSWDAEAGAYIITVGPVEPNLMAMVKATFMTTGAYDAWEEARNTEEEPEEEPDEEPEEEPKEEPEPEKTEPEEELDPEQEEKTEPQSEEDLEPKQQEENTPEEESGNETGEVQPEENRPESAETERTTEPKTEGTVLPKDRKVSTSITWDDEKPKYGSVAHIHATLIGYEEVEYTLQWQWSEDRVIWNDVEGGTKDTLDVVYSPENGDYRWRIMLYIIDSSAE